jgi:hypothetical protein
MKYTLALLLAIALRSPLAAQTPPVEPAAAVEVCTSPDSYIEQAGEYRHGALTGEGLRAYIDGFNATTDGRQGYDEFDRIEVYELGNEKIGWAFFKDGCLVDKETVSRELHDKILNSDI